MQIKQLPESERMRDIMERLGEDGRMARMETSTTDT
jgi:hypothetical protein